MSHYPIKYVSETELRQIFNEQARCVERAEAGELTMEILADNHPSKPKAREPFCTRSQLVVYKDRQKRVMARAHRYMRQDGTIGASGKPDPKQVLYNLTLYRLQP